MQDTTFGDNRVNPSGLLAYLLRESDRSGGGDLGVYAQTVEHVDGLSNEEMMRLIAAKARATENIPLTDTQRACVYAGRWAGDRITMIGDYDTGGLYDALTSLPRWQELNYEACAEEFLEMIIKPIKDLEQRMEKAEQKLRETHPDDAPDRKKAVTLVLDDAGFSTMTTEPDGEVHFDRYNRP